MDEETIDVAVPCHRDHGDDVSFDRRIAIAKAADLTFDRGSRSWTGVLPTATALDIRRCRQLVEARREAGAGVILARSAVPVDAAQAPSSAIGNDGGTP